MIVSFLGTIYNPYIQIEFNNRTIYRYSGFEIGFMNITKRKFYKKPGKLVAFLKTFKSIKVEKLLGEIK